MGRRRLVMVVLGSAVVVMAVLLSWPREREPRYEGRALSEWFLWSTPRQGSAGRGRGDDEARNAFSHIGTNGLPWVLKWIQYQPHPWRTKLFAIAAKLPPPLRTWDRAPCRTYGAWAYIEVLGARASPAIPDLIQLMHNTKSAETYFNVIGALSAIGKDAIPPLVELLNNPPASNRVAAVIAIGAMRDLGTNAALAVRALVGCLNDPDPDLAKRAAWALGNPALEPDLALPALAKALEAPSAGLRVWAAKAIIRFGDQGRPAIPALVRALDDSNFSVRSAATNTLRQIAPEVLPQLPGGS